MRYVVLEPWTSIVRNPISIVAGELVELTGRQDHWDGNLWLWAKSEIGLEGWIPDSLIDKEDVEPRANEDYTAVELSCVVGQELIGIKETHGWVYCYAENGQMGWVPKRNLSSQE